MKRSFKIFLLLLLFLFFTNIEHSFAESIESIDILVELSDEGTAHVTQKWKVDSTEGTEYYIPIQNLKHMELKKFSVSDEEGTEYQKIKKWDINAKLEQKTNKCGIVKNKGGFELCWGKGSYGQKTYIVKWDYLHAVNSYKDYDGFNIRFVNDEMNPAPEKVKVTIKKENTDFTSENTAIWAFGYKGEINFNKTGEIVAHNDEPLKGKNYLNILARFDKGIFKPDLQKKGSFMRLQKKALKNSSYSEEKKEEK